MKIIILGIICIVIAVAIIFKVAIKAGFENLYEDKDDNDD